MTYLNDPYILHMNFNDQQMKMNYQSTFSYRRQSESTASTLSMWRTPVAVFTQSST